MAYRTNHITTKHPPHKITKLIYIPNCNLRLAIRDERLLPNNPPNRIVLRAHLAYRAHREATRAFRGSGLPVCFLVP